MTIFTLPSTTYLRSLTTLTGGDWLYGGGYSLTIDTDTRIHANAPYKIPYNTGSGTVPAVGTTISQGGVSATLLGVFTGLQFNVAASTVGGAMPTSGYIKVKQIQNGSFAAGALTGITATATATESMEGTLFYLYPDLSLGGDITIDATNIRHLPFDTGSGNVPAVGTSISQGGVVGELLSIHASTTTRHLYQGEAMPTSGIMRFRVVTGGAFAAGALTGVSANATGADVVGAMTISWDAQGAIYLARANRLRTHGDYYQVGLTTGSAGQLVQIPTWGATNLYPSGIEIETSAGSGVYDKYPAFPTTYLNTTNLGTDARNKLVEAKTDGTLQIGNLNSTGRGYVPPVNCKIRIPNIIFQYSLYSARENNYFYDVTNWSPSIRANYGGDSEISHLWGFIDIQAAESYKSNFYNCWIIGSLTIQHPLTPIILTNVATSSLGTTAVAGIYVLDNYGAQITDCVLAANRGSAIALTATAMDTLTITNCRTLAIDYISSATTNAQLHLANCLNVVINGLKTTRAGIAFSACNTVKVTNYDYTRSLNGETDTTGIHAIYLSTYNKNIKFDGVTFGGNGTYANQCPYSALVYSVGGNELTVRNIGTPASPITNNGTNRMGNILNAPGGRESQFLFQRLYFDNLSSALFVCDAKASNIIFDNVWGLSSSVTTLDAWDMKVRSCAFTDTTSNATGIYGSHWMDGYTGATTGRLAWYANGVSPSTSAYYTLISGNPFFTGLGRVNLNTLGDSFTFESIDWVKGYIAFENTTPVISGGTLKANITVEYDLNTGRGYTGTYKALSAANLIGEDVSDYTTGFKVKLKFTCNTSTSTVNNTINHVRIYLTTNSTAKLFKWPLAIPPVCYTNCEANSGSAIFDSTTGTFLDYATSATSTVCVYPEWNADFAAIVRLRHPQFKTIEHSITVIEEGKSILAVQKSNGQTASNPGALSITITNHGATPVTWKSKDWSITIQVSSDGITGAQIFKYLSYYLARDATFNSFHAFAWPDMVISAGVDFSTERGTLIGSLGSTLKGTRVLKADGVTPHPDFTSMQADDGTHYLVPVTGEISAPNISIGARVQLINTTTATEMYNDVLASAGFSFGYVEGTGFTSGDNFKLRATLLGYTPIDITSAVTAGGAAITDSFVEDAVYTINGIDGSTVTEFAYDGVNVQIDVNDPDGVTTWQRFWAWYMYLVTTETGIESVGGFTAIDEINYRQNVEIMPFQVENINVIPVTIKGAYMFRSDGSDDICATTGFTIILNPGKAYLANISGLAQESSVQTCIALSV